MIKVQDWIASIPDGDKHIAYVGEGKSEQREFLLCGAGWEAYKNFTFYLDMAFDPTSITTHDHRQVVQTTHNSNESKEEAGVILDEITTKETYTVDNVQMTNHDLTDISPLDKANTDAGIRLTWTILRHQTILPGKLWATIRAVDHEEQRIKKSAIMTFEVDAAICAVPATVPPVSEFEQMETSLGFIRQMTEILAGQAEDAAKSALNAEDNATRSAETATIAASSALNDMYLASAAADEAKQSAAAAATDATQAQTAAQQAATHARTAEQAASTAETHQKSAATHAASAALSAQGAELSSADARSAMEKCNRYNLRSETAADQAEKSAADAKKYAEQAAQSSAVEYNRINVRDFGAIGDGVADDRQAIIDAFTAAQTMLPCEVYFPAGTYGISNGITVEMAYGTGGLLVRGAGRDITTIKYLESYNPDQAENMWHAIRIWPVGMPSTKPTNDEDYLHDISITGLRVYDTDPIAHAWDTAKGDPDKAGTHGFDIQFCKRVSVTDCIIDSVGEEGIDVCACYDVVVTNNHLVHTPAAGSSGGAISIGDGCKGVVVSDNTINGSAADEVLDDGTILTKSNFGIAVESLYVPVEDVIIIGNVVSNTHGNGIHFATTNSGSRITNLLISHNIIVACDVGIRSSGFYDREGIRISENIITDCAGRALHIEGTTTDNQFGVKDVSVNNNTFRNIGGDYAIRCPAITSKQMYSNNALTNLQGKAMYVSGDVTIQDCLFDGVCLGGRDDAAVIHIFNGALSVYGCRLVNVLSKTGIYGASVVENTNIELTDTNGVVDGSCDPLKGANLTRVVNCRLGGRFTIGKDNAIVQGVTITSSNIGANAITIRANSVIVTGCNININAYSAIMESGGFNRNLFANNIVNRGITVQGAQTVSVNNVDTRIMA